MKIGGEEQDIELLTLFVSQTKKKKYFSVIFFTNNVYFNLSQKGH